MSSRISPRARMLRAAGITAIALLAGACAADGPDAHLAGGTEPESPEPAEAAGSAVDETADDAADDAVAEEEVAAESESAPSESVAPNGIVETVLALDNSFIDEVVEVEAGTEILWTNNGRNDHDIIPVDPTETWGIEIEDFPPGAEYSHVFGTPGEYAYYCTVHGTETVGMTGTIVVTG